MAAPVPQVMDEKVDTEIAAPAQVSMMEDPQHGAYSRYESLGQAHPTSGDSMYSKLFCVTASIGDVAGEVMVGEETKFCCIQSQVFCGFDGGSKCPQANGGCFMFKPELVCEGSAKLFCIKVGFLLPKAPLIVCCQKEVYGGY
eukprot:s74_g14.t1